MLKISGASDDVIVVEGAITEEFTYNNDAEGDLIGCSDGTVLRIKFTDEGWRITRLAAGTAPFALEQATDEGGTDVATLNGDVAWVVHGMSYARVK